MKKILLTKLACQYADCEWQSSTVKAEADDGSIMTDYRRHVDREHRQPPKRVTWTGVLKSA